MISVSASIFPVMAARNCSTFMGAPSCGMRVEELAFSTGRGLPASIQEAMHG